MRAFKGAVGLDGCRALKPTCGSSFGVSQGMFKAKAAVCRVVKVLSPVIFLVFVTSLFLGAFVG